MWGPGSGGFENIWGPGILEVVNLSLDESDLEVVLFVDGDEDEVIGVGSIWKKASYTSLVFWMMKMPI